MLFAADGFLGAFFFAQSAKPSTTESTAVPCGGPPLVLSNRGQNAQTGHYLYVGQHWHYQRSVSQVHAALDESKQDFERPSLVARDLGNVEQLRTLPSAKRFGRIRKVLRCSLKRRHVAGWELEGPMGHATFFLASLRRETLSPFHCFYRFARKFHIDGNLSGSVHVLSWRLLLES